MFLWNKNYFITLFRSVSYFLPTTHLRENFPKIHQNLPPPNAQWQSQLTYWNPRPPQKWRHSEGNSHKNEWGQNRLRGTYKSFLLFFSIFLHNCKQNFTIFTKFHTYCQLILWFTATIKVLLTFDFEKRPLSWFFF